MAERDVSDGRRYAALASGGHSNAPIYQAFSEAIQELNLAGRVLDYGAGNGALARELCVQRRFTEVYAVDLVVPEDPAVRGQARWSEADLNEGTPYPSGMFDVILSAEVIEHLENPRAVAREWFRLLRPGGTLIFSTPNNESMRSLIALIVRGHYVAFGETSYPAHITPLLRADMYRIALEAGFADVQFRFTNNGGVPGWPKTTWQSVSLGRLRGRLFSDNILCAAKRPCG